MNLKNIKNFKFDKNNFSLRKIKDSFWDFSLNRFGAVFMAIFFVAAILGGLIIYKYVYRSEWSDAQKSEYRLQVESKEVPFNESKFNEVLEKISNREKLKNNNNNISSRDIFEITK